MKGIRFYEEFGDKRGKRNGISAGNCIAVLVGNDYWSQGAWNTDALAAVFAQPDSPVATSGVSPDYLRETCKRVSEARARVVHPQLFERLDMAE